MEHPRGAADARHRVARHTAGIAGLTLYFSTIPLQSVVRDEELQLIFDRLGLRLWVLEIILVITALIFAIIGVIGYQAI